MLSTLPEDIRKVLAVLVQNYPYWLKDRAGEIGGSFAIYEQLLQDIPAKILEAAALQHISQSRYFPTVAELREISFAITRPPRLTALEAWHSRDDELGREIKRMLPNYDARDITLREQSMIRSQFMKTYEQMAKREDQETQMLPQLQKLREQLLLEDSNDGEE